MQLTLKTSAARDPSAARRNIVPSAVEELRNRIFALNNGEMIGSLRELARSLGVGIVTIQQAARILEHEGVLEVRRGPGGGYYGRRPDAAVLERSLAAYMRLQPNSWEEALDMTSLLFNELCAATANSADPTHHPELQRFAARVDLCASEAEMGDLEQDFHDLLFRMVDRPLFELLTRVTMRLAMNRPRSEPIYRDAAAIQGWKAGRHRIIDAILRGDAALARFEANRSNRLVLLEWLGRNAQPAVPARPSASAATP